MVHFKVGSGISLGCNFSRSVVQANRFMTRYAKSDRDLQHSEKVICAEMNKENVFTNMYSSYFSRMYVKSYALTYLEQVHNPVSCWTCGCINLFKFEASEFKISLSSNKLQKRLLKNLNISRSEVTEKEKWKRKKKNLDDLKSKKCDPNKKEKPNFLPTNMFMKDLRLWDESELRILMMDPSPWDTSHLWFDQVFGFCSHANGGATRKKLIFSFIYNIACYNTKGMCLVSDGEK